MRGKRIRQVVVVKCNDIVDPFVEMRPQQFLAQETGSATVNAHDARTALIICVIAQLCCEHFPCRVINAPGDDVNTDTRCGQRQTDFLYVYQLTTEVGVLGKKRILPVEISLRVEKRNMYLFSSRGQQNSPC